MSLLIRRNGASHDAESLSQWFAGAIDKAGLPDDCVLHGLRKTGAVMYVEAGSGAPEGMAITGHKDPRVFDSYIRDANQKKLASSAMRKLRNAQRKKCQTPHGRDCQTSGEGLKTLWKLGHSH